MRLLICSAILAMVGCGAADNVSQFAQADSAAEGIYKTGEFKMLEKAGQQMGKCQIYTSLQLTGSPRGVAGAVATLQNKYYTAPNAFCPDVDMDTDLRRYTLKVSEGSCGTVILTGEKDGHKITISDYRAMTCRIAVPARVVVQETRDGETKMLYKTGTRVPGVRPNFQKIVKCVETNTFRDGPGNEYLISIGRSGKNAFVNSRPVQLRGGEAKPWQVEAARNRVENRQGGDLYIHEENEPTDWSKTDSCYKLVRATWFNLKSFSRDTYKGEVTQGGYIDVDPSVENCLHPHIRPAPPKKVQCTLY